MEKNIAKNAYNTKEVECIYSLIGELSREKPDVKVLKNLCVSVGLIYDSDLVQLMSKVLVRASCLSASPNKAKKSIKLALGEA